MSKHDESTGWRPGPDHPKTSENPGKKKVIGLEEAGANFGVEDEPENEQIQRDDAEQDGSKSTE